MSAFLPGVVGGDVVRSHLAGKEAGTQLRVAATILAERITDLFILMVMIIGKRVWVGANVTILPGVVIGENTVIGAGSVVTKELPSNSVAAGVPAKVKKKMDPSVKTNPFITPNSLTA